jgi:hypothetical protein
MAEQAATEPDLACATAISVTAERLMSAARTGRAERSGARSGRC